ncbi:Alw26I/Eco31I/Esp3I family type II restriction endonuclease [Ekhidna sp.]|uniref:Alw26I/Eco31I/Esp3I family type II restriction endonuclease n=1 Tax=Ekhidna sp. TaxID=2608089 RepID=UPI003B50660C
MAKYGRGKFEAHPNYIAYMESVVKSDSFKDMPNAISNGRINWQVSSGKSTSFYEYYKARWKWWAAKADSLGLPGKGNENERFTITARKINPTGYRACRLCGEDWNVGYFYLNSRFYNAIAKLCPEGDFFKWQPIDAALVEMKKHLSQEVIEELIYKKFPERHEYFNKFGVTKEAFEKSNHINAKAWLTPGYMGNPPDRLDGFHDYHFECRKSSDPGRFDDNMKSYNHDRRTFEFWSEGNWMVADTLYNSAGEGYCLDCPDGSEKIQVSPDHIGPLSCGFKQLALFKPLCSTHNSAKNRRFTFYDTELLLDWEKSNNDSVASFQVRNHWDKNKVRVMNDDHTKQLSNSMRSLQDCYFRILYRLWETGNIRFLCTLIKPQFAYHDVHFTDLDNSNFNFSSFEIRKKITPNRKSLFTRSLRIALESLKEYNSKSVDSRKLLRKDYENNHSLIENYISTIESFDHIENEVHWSELIKHDGDLNGLEETLGRLTEFSEIEMNELDGLRYELLIELMDKIGDLEVEL